MTFKKNAREIGFKLKKLREQGRWSQTEMGAYLGIRPSSYHKIETGKNSPSIDTLRRLWDKFDISLNWLFFDDGPRYRKEIGKMVTHSKPLEKAAVPDEVPALSRKPEVKELLSHMERDSMLYHEILLYFQKYKAGHKKPGEPAETVS